MNISKSKIVALITGFLSITICIIYLLLITVFDFRSFLNDQITNLSGNIAAVFFEIDLFELYHFVGAIFILSGIYLSNRKVYA